MKWKRTIIIECPIILTLRFVRPPVSCQSHTPPRSRLHTLATAISADTQLSAQESDVNTGKYTARNKTYLKSRIVISSKEWRYRMAFETSGAIWQSIRKHHLGYFKASHRKVGSQLPQGSTSPDLHSLFHSASWTSITTCSFKPLTCNQGGFGVWNNHTGTVS